MVFNDLCPPALIYLVFSFTQIVIDTMKGFYNMATVKLWVAFVFTILLNYLCQSGLGIISWVIVFIPFILMTVIVGILLVVFGLDPRTGKLKPKKKNKTCVNITEEEKKKLDDIKNQTTLEQSIVKKSNNMLNTGSEINKNPECELLCNNTNNCTKLCSDKGCCTIEDSKSKRECELYLRQVADILYNMNENFKASILTNQVQDCLANKTKEECIACARGLIDLTEKELTEDKRKIFRDKKNLIKIY